MILNQINTFAVYVIIFVVHAALRESHHTRQSRNGGSRMLWSYLMSFVTFVRGQMELKDIKISILCNVSLPTHCLQSFLNAISLVLFLL